MTAEIPKRTMDKDQWREYKRLTDSGVRVDKHNNVRFNSGSETLSHVMAKAVAARVMAEQGYRVSGEVTVPDGEVDVVAWHPGNLNWAIEIETDLDELTVHEKMDRYLSGTAIDDICVVDISEVLVDVSKQQFINHVKTNLPL